MCDIKLKTFNSNKISNNLYIYIYKWIAISLGQSITCARMDQSRLCNGTRLAVKKLMNNVIKATILNGKYKGEDVLIPQVPLIPNDMPFEFKRLQFPVRLAFAMLINKSQGQSLSVCGYQSWKPMFLTWPIICCLFQCLNTNKTIYICTRKKN